MYSMLFFNQMTKRFESPKRTINSISLLISVIYLGSKIRRSLTFGFNLLCRSEEGISVEPHQTARLELVPTCVSTYRRPPCSQSAKNQTRDPGRTIASPLALPFPLPGTPCRHSTGRPPLHYCVTPPLWSTRQPPLHHCVTPPLWSTRRPPLHLTLPCGQPGDRPFASVSPLPCGQLGDHPSTTVSPFPCGQPDDHPSTTVSPLPCGQPGDHPSTTVSSFPCGQPGDHPATT